MYFIRNIAILLFVLGLSGCVGGGGGTSSSNNNDSNSGSNNSTASGILQQPANKTGRLLASNCFQCHGTGGLGGFNNIRGTNTSEANQFRSGTANQNIMNAHAQGYTNAQWQEIITYLQQ